MRAVVYDAYGDDAYTKGIKVYTTIRTRDQEAAYVALRRGVMDYDRRHGYRGPEAFVNLPADGSRRLREEHAIYVLESGRIILAGLNDDSAVRFAHALQPVGFTGD